MEKGDIASFFVKDLMAQAPKMCPDQSQAFKEVNNSQAFTVGRKKIGQTTQQGIPWSNHDTSGYPFYTDITRTQLIGQRHISP